MIDLQNGALAFDGVLRLLHNLFAMQGNERRNPKKRSRQYGIHIATQGPQN
jgi:hypothetical protein